MLNPKANHTTESIWHSFHDKLYQMIRSRIGDHFIAEDILQEVFIRIHTRMHTLQDDHKIQSWIYQITRNAIVDHYRKYKPTEELPEEIRSENPELDEVQNINQARQEISDCVSPLIKQLSEPYRQAVLLSEIEGVKQKDIANQAGISLTGAKSRVQRGRAMVKEMLLECCQFEFDHQGKMIDYVARRKNCDNCTNG